MIHFPSPSKPILMKSWSGHEAMQAIEKDHFALFEVFSFKTERQALHIAATEKPKGFFSETHPGRRDVSTFHVGLVINISPSAHSHLTSRVWIHACWSTAIAFIRCATDTNSFKPRNPSPPIHTREEARRFYLASCSMASATNPFFASDQRTVRVKYIRCTCPKLGIGWIWKSFF